MAQPLRIQRDDTGPATGVVTLYLDDPARPVTVMSRNMVERLDTTLDEIGDSPAGLVLATSESRVFVAGADLAEINDLSDEDLDAYLADGQRVLGRIAALSCPTVAAINGAALGGGLELALHCDVLMGLKPANPDKPYRVGLPEASLGLCPGWGGDNTLPARIEPAGAIKAIAAGATWTAFEARDAGLLESFHDSRESLLEAAKIRALELSSVKSGACNEPINISAPKVSPVVNEGLGRVRNDLPKTEAAQAVVDCVTKGLHDGWRSALALERVCLVELRKTDRAREKIEAFFARSAK